MDRRAILLILFLILLPSILWAEIAIVEEIIDADTLKVKIDGKIHTVILLGVDSPTSKMGPALLKRARALKLKPEEVLKMGKEAKAFVMHLIPPGSQIRLEYDWVKLDQKGRIIAYVYLLRDGMLNEILLEQGYARARLVFPFPFKPKKSEIISLFYFLERKAKRQKRGLWRYGEF